MHRLDQDTSGCLLFARRPRRGPRFQQAFEARRVEKYYLAVVGSEIAEEEGVIDLALAQEVERRGRVADGRRPAGAGSRRRSGAGLAVRDGATLVEFQPLTGRTHQIRAHAREAFGRGIVGDRVYGVPGRADAAPRVAAGGAPGRKPAIDVSAPLPHYFGEWRDAA